MYTKSSILYTKILLYLKSSQLCYMNITCISRDMFYELLREWEEYRHSPGWSMADAMGERIRSLVGGRPDLANHVHFARLFQSQLIQVSR